MIGTGKIGTMMVAGGMMLSLAGCSRTSDGTVVVPGPGPVSIPSFNLEPAKRLVPSWMKPDEPEPVVARDFPPPPVKRTAPRRQTQPPVVTSGSGGLSCRNVSEGDRVRMLCE